MYFGLDGKPRLTVEEIAQRFGVSHTTAAKWRNQGLATLGVTLPKRGCIPSRTVWCPDVRHGNRDRLRPRTGARSCRAGHPIEGDNRVYGRARNGAAIYACRPCAQEKDLRSLPQLPDDWRSRVEPGQVLVIEWYFGIGGPRRTMEQIAQELGVQQPCVQKRRDKALRRLGIVLPARSTVVSRTLWDVSYRHPKLT